MVPTSFSKYLEQAGIDETTLNIPVEHAHKRDERRRQLLSFHQQALLEPVAVEACDSAGQPINVGDTVKITLVVTGVHAIPDDAERGLMGRTYLNLARMEDGSELHQFNYASELVKKV